MPIRLWPKDYAKKDHISQGEKILLRNAARNLKEGHFAVDIDPVRMSTSAVKMGLYLSPREGLVTFSIYTGEINPAMLDAYIMYVQMVEDKIYERLLDSKMLIVRTGEYKVLKFPYKHMILFPEVGITVFTMFFDRLRGKNQGITAFLKYPLRLLAVQQLDRVLTIIMQTNKVRMEAAALREMTEFRVGFYVGNNNTPNKIDTKERLSSRGGQQQDLDLILESDQDTLDEYYRFIDTCPCCCKKHIHLRFNKERWVLEHICDNPECEVETLPLFIVDSEIYRYLP